MIKILYFVSIAAILTRRTAPRRVLRRIEHAARYTGAAHLGIDLLGLCSIVSWYLALGTWCSVLGTWCLILCRLKDKSRGFVRPERAGVEQSRLPPGLLIFKGKNHRCDGRFWEPPIH